MAEDPDNNPLRDAHLDTLAVRAGVNRGPEGEHSEPIFATSSYVFANAAEAADRFAGEESGNVYSRYTNPTVRVFEQRIAGLDLPEAVAKRIDEEMRKLSVLETGSPEYGVTRNYLDWATSVPCCRWPSG